MTETTHTRSRRASLFGLVIQVVVFGGLLGLSYAIGSFAMNHLAWYVLGGIPIWGIALLVFRQHELADLEAMDLEELRREKAATGGGDAIFDEEGRGFRVAEARLRWMRRWLLPTFGLLNAIYLAGMAFMLWRALLPVNDPAWPELKNLPLAMIVSAVIMVVQFLFSRYASGMGRVGEWQLLRACGSYMLGNTLATLTLIVCFGVDLYAGVATWEQVLAYAIPVLMLILAAETVINFVADVYRPRTPGTEPRACFDSRILALVSEPGGIASSIADAINYQFGFQVTQSWFYRLLERAFVPLVGTGALALWLLTCIVIVQPGQRCIIERWGQQINADAPLADGIYVKWPAPIDMARIYDTGKLHQIFVGFARYDAEPDFEADGIDPADRVVLWTQERHMGQEHFNFLISTPPSEPEPSETDPPGGDVVVPNPVETAAESPANEMGLATSVDAETSPADGPAQPQTAPRDDLDVDFAEEELLAIGGGETEAVPVNIMRLDVVVQYKILAERLAAYTQNMADAHRTLRNIAWEEVVRFNASSDVDALLSARRKEFSATLLKRISERVAALDLGLEIVYVGLENVHPEKTVAEAYRKVVGAEQERVASVRSALVTENEILSSVAGDAEKAIALAQAMENLGDQDVLLNRSQRALEALDAERKAALLDRLSDLRPLFLELVKADFRYQRLRQHQIQVAEDYEYGIGRRIAERRAADEAVENASAAVRAAAAQLQRELDPLRASLADELPAGVSFDALVGAARARVALEFWNRRLEDLLRGLEGQAAALLASAQAERWEIEMKAAAEVARLEQERDAYAAAPEIYKTRRFLQTLVGGLQNARKFFLAFDPAGRVVRVRVVAEEEGRMDFTELPSRMEQQ